MDLYEIKQALVNCNILLIVNLHVKLKDSNTLKTDIALYCFGDI